MIVLVRQTLAILLQHRRGLLIFYLFFAGIALSVLAPVFSWALAALQPVTGEAAITTGGLLQFLTSWGGLIWLFVTSLLAVLVIVLQQAGMLLIASTQGSSEYRIVLWALWGVARKFVRLLALTIIQVAAHWLVTLPFLLAIAQLYSFFLSPYDLYYLRLVRPMELWWFGGIAGALLLGAITVNGWLFLRWILAVPLVVLDNQEVKVALRDSIRLSRKQRLPALAALMSGLAAVVIMPITVTLVFRAVGGHVLEALPQNMDLLVPIMLFYAGLYTLSTLTLAFFGIAAYSTLVYAIHERVSGAHRGPRSLRISQKAGPIAWTAEVLLIVLALSQSWLVVHSHDFTDNVSVTAHRGSSMMAPENTRSAIELAIADGADYVEVDVRMTADGIPVLWHDANMRRIFGLDGKISDITYEEALELDAGLWFSPDFEGERILTLQQAIAITRGRVGLYVDIKPDADTPTLTRDVVELLQQEDAIERTVVAAADSQVLNQVKRLEPSLRTTLLAQFIVGPLHRESFDILGLRHNRVNAASVAETHHSGQELHVWTVNQRDDMARFIDMGVDNIITDRPDVLVELIRERSALTDAELFVTKMRNWLR